MVFIILITKEIYVANIILNINKSYFILEGYLSKYAKNFGLLVNTRQIGWQVNKQT